ncbi:uncharacterized protein LOC116254534 isoform X1 [Nymphaea colorata]|nr:uncharacterized protein LOC116254534 isoform X1 [Nymphaea colorata]XP_031485837.1 uncharacterized protein LOC116254534 isoform X1 [Nymphaea colorata]
MHRLEYLVILLLCLGSPGLNLRTLASIDTDNKVHSATENGTVGLPVNGPGQSSNVTEKKSKISPLPGPLPAPLPKTGNDSVQVPPPHVPDLPSGSNSKEPNMTKSSDSRKIDRNSPPLLPPPLVPVNSTTPEKQDGAKKRDGSKAPTGNAPPVLPSEVHDNTTRDDGEASTHSGVSEKSHKEWCNTSISCTDNKNLSACLFVTQNEPNQSSLVVHNDGEDDLHVIITIAGSSFHQVKQLKQHGKLKVILPGVGSEVPKAILNAGNGECVLQRKQSLSNIFQDLPLYASLVTPTYGAYFLAFAVLTVGGTCLCCKLRRQRQRHGGVRYQELEMSLPESGIPGTATSRKLESDPADGWDRDWDDGWEDEESARPNRPMNGYASRATEKDGWEDNWDD